MKIFRSELDSEFKDRLFDITIGNLPNNGSRFNNDIIQCTLSSTKVRSGFHLTGVLSAEQVYDCDCCLESFSVSGQVRLKLWLISDQDLPTLDMPTLVRPTLVMLTLVEPTLLPPTLMEPTLVEPTIVRGT